jgi:hypothetical protein
MARTNLPLSTLVPNGNLAAPAGTNVDPTNGMNVAIPTTALPAGPNLNSLVLVVNNTAASSKVVTVRAGVGGGVTPGPAFRAGQGDLAVTVGASGTQYIGPFETARFAQSDGSLNIDMASGITGTITALIMPTRW